MVKRYNVKGVNSPQGRFSHVGEIGPNARLYYLAGQTGVAPDGSVAADFAGQGASGLCQHCRRARRMRHELAEHRQGHHLSPRPRRHARLARHPEGTFAGVVPASTLLVVSRLARPEYRIEVEVVAAKD